MSFRNKVYSRGHKKTELTNLLLFSYREGRLEASCLLPDEVCAVAAEGGLLEEARDEFVVLHLVHVLLPQRAFAGEAVRERG